MTPSRGPARRHRAAARCPCRVAEFHVEQSLDAAGRVEGDARCRRPCPSAGRRCRHRAAPRPRVRGRPRRPGRLRAPSRGPRVLGAPRHATACGSSQLRATPTPGSAPAVGEDERLRSAPPRPPRRGAARRTGPPPGRRPARSASPPRGRPPPSISMSFHWSPIASVRAERHPHPPREPADGPALGDARCDELEEPRVADRDVGDARERGRGQRRHLGGHRRLADGEDLRDRVADRPEQVGDELRRARP